MNFVADESCAKPVIQALREAGLDVVTIAEATPRCGGWRSGREQLASDQYNVDFVVSGTVATE